MSYKTYTTLAFVCGSHSHNTSDKNYLLFTREAGMLFATARSVREEKSKQRSALVEFSLVRVSLVKGKSGWRIGSAQALGNTFLSSDSRTARALVHFLYIQLRRYLHGEIPFPDVFDEVSEILADMDYFTHHRSATESVFLLRMLCVLGYIAPQTPWNVLIETNTLREAVSVYTPDLSGAVGEATKQAIAASHL